MSFMRTVLGDIAPEQFGACDAHEHVIIERSFTTGANPDFLLDDVERAVSEVAEFRTAGGGAIVDSMPCDCGRNVRKLAEVSARTGVHIVCPTGLHLAKYYDAGHWGDFYSAEELAELFVADIEQGIDARDYGGPNVRRTAHRAGVIKIATDHAWTAREEKVFVAAAAAHRATGCPILTHTEQGELALGQIEALRREGVALEHVCLSHTDRKPDMGYHREILASGVSVEFDSAFRWNAGQGNPTRELLLALLGDFPNQLMLGMDAARRQYWRSYGGGPGLSFLLTDFTAQLRAAGVSDAWLENIFVRTPAAVFSFGAGAERPARRSAPTYL